MLKIYNTLNKKKEIFKSKNKKIGIYVCGVTIYDFCHIGHARTFIFFDIINRYFKYLNYKTNYVRNITDIDDKIINRAKKNKETYQNLTSKMLNEMYKDFDNLNILRPNFEPKVTLHIPEIIKLIKKLIKLGHAYISNNGDVMYKIGSDPNYGILSNQNIKKLKIQNERKKNKKEKNKLDFVLWKISKSNEPNWSSPWGNGRPGWHTECSAINKKYFPKICDIHGGGIDLVFPHHENEITQFSSAYKKKYVNYWMHVGMIQINKKKMSKSLNNSLTIRETLKKFNSETIRYFLLSKHYRNNLNYSEKNLKKSFFSLRKLYIALKGTNTKNIAKTQKKNFFKKRFLEAMDDDFNTPKAYSVLFSLAKTINKLKIKNKKKANYLAIELKKLANILGFLLEKPDHFFKKNKKKIDIKILKKLIELRNQARKKKEWDKADLIRKKIFKMGILLEDQKNKTKWYIKY